MTAAKNLWKQFAEEMNGRYIERHYWHSDKAEVYYKNWKIIFDYYTHYTTAGNNSYEQKYTRVIAPFVSAEDFMFELYPNNIFSSVAKIFGAQDVETGYPEFDKAYIIKSNNGFKLKSLLADKAIRKQIESIKNINLQISNQKGVWEEKLPKNEYELSFFTEGKITDLSNLKDVFSLFTALLDQLDKIHPIADDR